MQFTAPQQQLIRLAKTPVRGISLTVIQIEEYGAGLTSALRHIEHTGSVSGPRSLVLDGVSPWDALRSLAKKTGLPGNGQGYFDTFHAALLRMTGNGKRAAALWLEEARMMRPAQREQLFAHLAYIAEHCECDIRLAFLIGRVSIWKQEQRARVSDFPALGNRLLHRAEAYTYSRAGLEHQSTRAKFGMSIAREPGPAGELAAVAS